MNSDPASMRQRKYTERQRRIIEKYYADDDTNLVAEAAEMTPLQVRCLAARIGVKKSALLERNNPKPFTDKEVNEARRISYREAGYNYHMMRFADSATLDVEMVTGTVRHQPVGRITMEEIRSQRDLLMRCFPRAIASYITIPSLVNTQ